MPAAAAASTTGGSAKVALLAQCYSLGIEFVVAQTGKANKSGLKAVQRATIAELQAAIAADDGIPSSMFKGW